MKLNVNKQSRWIAWKNGVKGCHGVETTFTRNLKNYNNLISNCTIPLNIKVIKWYPVLNVPAVCLCVCTYVKCSAHGVEGECVCVCVCVHIHICMKIPNWVCEVFSSKLKFTHLSTFHLLLVLPQSSPWYFLASMLPNEMYLFQERSSIKPNDDHFAEVTCLQEH